jgi:hypothetical protein
MASPDAARLLQSAMNAHGGLARWQRVAHIEASLSSWGLAFTLKGQGQALKNLRIRVQPDPPAVVLLGFGGKGGSGQWTPERVTMFDDAGQLLAQRDNPYAAFFTWRKRLSWDQLDILYFAGKALWNYLCFPFYLGLPGVVLTQQGPQQEQGLYCLAASFAPSVPSHSAEERFHLDRSGLLVRHDYTATVIGDWAVAANRCLASETVSGLRFYTRRRVTPRLGRHRVLPLPMLVAIELKDIVVYDQ